MGTRSKLRRWQLAIANARQRGAAQSVQKEAVALHTGIVLGSRTMLSGKLTLLLLLLASLAWLNTATAAERVRARQPRVAPESRLRDRLLAQLHELYTGGDEEPDLPVKKDYDSFAGGMFG